MRARVAVGVVTAVVIASAAVAQTTGGAGGAVVVPVAPDQQTFSVVIKRPDGTLARTEVTGEQQAADLVRDNDGTVRAAESDAADLR